MGASKITLKKILLSILPILIGGIIFYLNPGSYIHRLIFFITIWCSSAVILYRGESFSLRGIAKDKIYFVLFILLMTTGLFTLFFLYRYQDGIYTYFSLLLFVLSLMGWIIRSWVLIR